MSRDQPDKIVLVCSSNGRTDRFFGKYKSFDTNEWKRIPGGAFPPAFDTKDKALAFAKDWYAQAKIDHETHLRTLKVSAESSWSEICDVYLAEVKGRMRGKVSTRHEAITVVNASIRNGILSIGKPSENDETRCILWLRSIVNENIASSGAAPRTRKPKTIRNIAKQLRYLFKVVVRRKLIAGLVSNPTTGDEFKDELKAIMAGDQQREWFLPLGEFRKLVACPEIPSNRTIMYLTLGLTGLRPGELAGLQLRHLMKEGNVRYFSIEQQFTERRPKLGGGKVDTLKTKWARRNIPLHRSLKGPLDLWLESGWEPWVGRPPTADDFLFPDQDGQAYRRHDADGFREDLETAGCATSFNGEPLKPYALRHLFSTMLTEVHAHDAAHDRLMGHRPKDTKTLAYSVKQLPFLAAEIEKFPFDPASPGDDGAVEPKPPKP